MKRLYLLRHAKSSWEDRELPDHERPLAPRGRRAAPAMGAYMREQGLVPECVLCSTAVRARQTWELIAPALSPPPAVAFREEVYDGDAAALAMVVTGQPDDCDAVLLIGHNPALEDCAARLAGRGDKRLLSAMAKKYPTAALAEIVFDVRSWRDIEPGTGRLLRFVRPKDVA